MRDCQSDETGLASLAVSSNDWVAQPTAARESLSTSPTAPVGTESP